MKSFIVNLKDEYKVNGGELECILIEKPLDSGEFTRPALLVLPGGGYYSTSRREGESVATAFLARGYQTFILHYACRKENEFYPEPILEYASAVDYIKKHAKEFHVNPNEVFVVGFSAGGHLAGSLPCMKDEIKELKGLDTSLKGMGLCYPVISEEFGHEESFDNLLAPLDKDEQNRLKDRLSLHKRVDKNTPSTFIWTTSKDSNVPCQNSLAYAIALANAKVEYELHIYKEGDHGLSTCDYEVNNLGNNVKENGVWVEDMAKFFRSLAKEKF